MVEKNQWQSQWQKSTVIKRVTSFKITHSKLRQ